MEVSKLLGTSVLSSFCTTSLNSRTDRQYEDRSWLTDFWLADPCLQWRLPANIRRGKTYETVKGSCKSKAVIKTELSKHYSRSQLVKISFGVVFSSLVPPPRDSSSTRGCASSKAGGRGTWPSRHAPASRHFLYSACAGPSRRPSSLGERRPLSS